MDHGCASLDQKWAMIQWFRDWLVRFLFGSPTKVLSALLMNCQEEILCWFGLLTPDWLDSCWVMTNVELSDEQGWWSWGILQSTAQIAFQGIKTVIGSAAGFILLGSRALGVNWWCRRRQKLSLSSGFLWLASSSIHAPKLLLELRLELANKTHKFLLQAVYSIFFNRSNCRPRV